MVGGDTCGAVGRNFCFKPSVGTWLQPIHHGSERMDVAVSNATRLSLETQVVVDLLASKASALSPSESNQKRPAFARRPSVGTWLQVRLVEAEEEHKDNEEKDNKHDQFCHDFIDKLKALEFADARPASWEADFGAADFGAFAPCPPNHKSLVDDDFCEFTTSLPAAAMKCSDSTPMHETEIAICDNSPLGPFRLAPPPSPATNFSVGSVSPKKRLLIFEDCVSQCRGFSLDKSEPLPVTTETEDGIGMDDDDQELLLGCEASETDARFNVRNKSRPDDLDSASESEAEAPALLLAERQSDCRTLETSPEPAARLRMNLFPDSAETASKPPSRLLEEEAPETEGDSTSHTCLTADPPQTKVPRHSMKDIDIMLSESLDRFFGNDRLWGQVGREVARGTRGLIAHPTTSRFLVLCA